MLFNTSSQTCKLIISFLSVAGKKKKTSQPLPSNQNQRTRELNQSEYQVSLQLIKNFSRTKSEFQLITTTLLNTDAQTAIIICTNLELAHSQPSLTKLHSHLPETSQPYIHQLLATSRVKTYIDKLALCKKRRVFLAPQRLRQFMREHLAKFSPTYIILLLPAPHYFRSLFQSQSARARDAGVREAISRN